MNLPYPVPQHTHRSISWLLVVALILASLILALQIIGQPALVDHDHPAAVPANREIPEAVPVPEPPQNQPVSPLRASATPGVRGSQIQPALRPVPVPQPGK